MPPRKPTTVTNSDDYTYELEDGRTVTLPPFNSVKPGIIRKIRKLSDVDQFFTVLETLADDATIAIIDDMNQPEFEEFQTGWFKHAGVDLGE